YDHAAARQEPVPLAGPNAVAQAQGARHRPAPGGDPLQAKDPRAVPERGGVWNAHLRRGSRRTPLLRQICRVALRTRGRDARCRDRFAARLRSRASSREGRATSGADPESHAPPRRRNRRHGAVRAAAFAGAHGHAGKRLRSRVSVSRPRASLCYPVHRFRQGEVKGMRLFRLVLVVMALTVAACSSKPTTIDVAQKKVKIYGLERGQRLTVRVLDKKGRPVEKAAPTFSSSKNDVATVDAGGRIVAKSEGKAVVTVTFEKLSTQVPVEVVDIKTIEVLPASVQLIGPVGTKFPLQAIPKNSKDKPVDAKADWSSPKPAIASVSSEGVVTSVAPGLVTLVAKIGDVESACEVRVSLRDVARLEIHPATAIVKTGENQQFEVFGYGPDGRAIEGLNAVYQTSDATVARVNPVGVATGVAPGAATIRVSIGPVKAEATLIG